MVLVTVAEFPLLFADTNGRYLTTLFGSWINNTYVKNKLI